MLLTIESSPSPVLCIFACCGFALFSFFETGSHTVALEGLVCMQFCPGLLEFCDCRDGVITWLLEWISQLPSWYKFSLEEVIVESAHS